MRCTDACRVTGFHLRALQRRLDLMNGRIRQRDAAFAVCCPAVLPRRRAAWTMVHVVHVAANVVVRVYHRRRER